MCGSGMNPKFVFASFCAAKSIWASWCAYQPSTHRMIPSVLFCSSSFCRALNHCCWRHNWGNRIWTISLESYFCCWSSCGRLTSRWWGCPSSEYSLVLSHCQWLFFLDVGGFKFIFQRLDLSFHRSCLLACCLSINPQRTGCWAGGLQLMMLANAFGSAHKACRSEGSFNPLCFGIPLELCMELFEGGDNTINVDFCLRAGCHRPEFYMIYNGVIRWIHLLH